ncbi:Rhodanese-related sulfurtransferase [Ligilactobacillus sp. WC1T17]|uniref:Rhodanese-related sulfurtransferase n=1 Tax=Ligilactobacillus ruminis TaxID=1623 RepID=A0ABY1ABP4_9LACO|nr:Rhodanese-related sulfurtransferase [Ligilactobacillus ruminis]
MYFVLGVAHSVLFYVDIVLIAIILLMVGTQVYWWAKTKTDKRIVENDDFAKGLHRGQIVDLRDEAKFTKEHILGARNMPLMQLKMYQDSLRKDMPVYLYDDSMQTALRAANQLKKQGFTEVYVLKGGYSAWDGKKKVSK